MSSEKLNTKAAGIVSLAVLSSRVLGLAREVIFSALFGAGRNMDAFFMAFKAPNLLRDLFAEGALSTAFVTVFSKKIASEGDGSAWDLASKMATLAVVFMSAITILGIIFADAIIAVLAPGFDPEKAALTVLLTRIMYPFILLVSLAALAMGMLNAKNVFGVPAMASSFFNIGSIAGGVGFGYLLDPTFGERALIGLALGTLVGGLLQLAVQLPSLKKAGFRFRPDFAWRDPGVRQVLGLMVPSVIAASAVQVNVMINGIFASYLDDGAVSWLQYAFRLMQLPIGIFGVAVATVTLPVISRIAAGIDQSAFGPTLGKALRLAIFLTLPSAVGLYFLAEPILAVIYERGNFTSLDTHQTALALQFYALGLTAYSGIKVLAPAFYAIDRRWVPMLVSFAAIGVNVALNYTLIFQFGFGHRGLALSTTVSATLNFAILYFVMTRTGNNLESLRLAGSALRCVIAATALGVVCWMALTFGGSMFAASAFWIKVPLLAATIATAGGTYAVICWLLRVESARDATEFALAKIRRRISTPK